jgi:mitogen-activated protein kinase organizer 1
MAVALPLPTRCEATLRGHDGSVLCVRYNKDGKYCLSGGADRTVRLWNPHKGFLVKTYNAHAHRVLGVCSSADNSMMASVGGDKTVFYWDVSTGQVVRKFRGHDQCVNAVEFGAGQDVLVTGSYDRSVRVWDCRSKSWDPVQTMDAFGDSVTAVAVHGTSIIASSVDGTVRTFDIRRGEVITDRLHQPVTHIALSNDGNCVLASRLDSRLLLLERGSGDVLNEYAGHRNSEFKIQSCFSNTDAHVVSGSEDGKIVFWDLVEGTVVHTLSQHTSVVTSVAYHPQPGEISMLSSDVSGSIKHWKA